MPWYKSEALAILALFICPPVGVVLTWFQRWDPIVKTVASLFSLSGSIVLLLVLANGSSANDVAAGSQAAAVNPAVQAAAPAKPAGAPGAAAVQASTAPVSAQQAPPPPITSNPQETDDMNPKNVFSRAFSGIGSALKGLTGDATQAPSAPPAAAANPQSSLTQPQAGSSQPGQRVAAKPAPPQAGALPVQASGAPPAAAPPAGVAAVAPPATAAQTLAAAQKKQVQDALNASVAHYSGLLDAGKAALGTTKYSDSGEAAAAIDTPGSPAAKFNQWRESSGVDEDVTFEDAYDQATTTYASAGIDIPPGLDNWLTDMTDVQSSVVDWADAATDWEGQDKTDAELADAEKIVRDGLNKARSDAQGV